MKYLLLALVPFVLGCGEKRIIPGSKVDIERYRPSLAAVTKGLTTIGTRRGNEHSYQLANGQVTPELREVSEEVFQVIVKVDGKKKYVYRKTIDLLNDGKVSEKIELDDSDTERELDQLLRTSQARIEGDALVTNLVIPVESNEIPGAVLSYRSTHRSKLNLLKPLCEFTKESQDTEIKITVSGKLQKLPDSGIVESYECGELMTDEELKKLDLSNIMFCEETSTGTSTSTDCRKRNMSFLTADL